MSEFLSLNRRIRLLVWRNRRYIILALALLAASLCIVLFSPNLALWAIPIGIPLVLLVVYFID
ncbi:hypothetical protein [Pseudidiomarina planktonica]|uniref:hypothetical protein n=1 Tax=Pseudidiomarina planktonica TaxID=1323738 RepID=UPI000A3A8FCB|nr:hypothetical protein [Pseudidiomarina planktonica]RUO65420.1 hypothetical protein CWI77_02885 [Pseudidiomarina planktonica]